jgi:hypothetical protein
MANGKATVIEFTCVECGAHVVDIVGFTEDKPKLCCICLAMPGWIGDPTLRAYFEKDPDRREALAARHAAEHSNG